MNRRTYLNQYNLENETLNQRFDNKVKEAMDAYEAECIKIHEGCHKVGHTPIHGGDTALHAQNLRKAAHKAYRAYRAAILAAALERSNARQDLDRKYMTANTLKNLKPEKPLYGTP